MSLKPHHRGRSRGAINWRATAFLLSSLCLAAVVRGDSLPHQIPSIFEPQSTPAESVYHLVMFVLIICAAIFVVVFFLIAYSALRFRAKRGDDASEPPQVYGSNRVELAWTVIPVLVVMVLFAAAARVIHSVQDAPKPPGAVLVTAVGHQFWWEYRYPKLRVVATNELHVPRYFGMSTMLALQISPTNIFAPASTPADSIQELYLFVLAVTGAIFLVVFGMLLYAAVKYRSRPGDDREPPQIYGSDQLELAWTVIPVLIVMVLFLSSARVIHAVQDARRPPGAIEVTAVGHQFWWEYRYPQYGFVTANELHVPVSDDTQPTPTFITLLSADTDHSFWVPRLSGKTDLIPNHPNSVWIDPHETGLYLGQCAQYCGTQHAKMLLRVYVESRADFDHWVQAQKQTVQSNATMSPELSEGRKVFETTACINCHTVGGTVADGRFGPDLTHLMSRETLASGVASNTPENLRLWIQNPDAIKPGALMPAMNLTDKELDEVTAYLLTLH